MPLNPDNYSPESSNSNASGVKLDLLNGKTPEEVFAEGNQFAQTTYPGTIADSGSKTSYQGSVPMGATLSINKDLNIINNLKAFIRSNPQEKTTYYLLALVSAVEKYGAYVVDVGIDTDARMVIDSQIPIETRNLIGGDPNNSYVYKNARYLKQWSGYVTNNYPYPDNIPFEQKGVFTPIDNNPEDNDLVTNLRPIEDSQELNDASISNLINYNIILLSLFIILLP